MLSTRPVSRLSNTVTLCSLAIKRSTRWDPRKPAPPVIKTCILDHLWVRQQLVGKRNQSYQPRSFERSRSTPDTPEWRVPLRPPVLIPESRRAYDPCR